METESSRHAWMDWGFIGRPSLAAADSYQRTQARFQVMGALAGWPVVDFVSEVIPESSVTVTGSGFITPNAVAIGSVSQTVGAETYDSLTLTAVLGNNPYFLSRNLVVTPSGAPASAAVAVVYSVPVGKKAVLLTSIETESDYRWEALPDIEIDDHIEVSNAVGGSIDDLTPNPDGTWTSTNVDLIYVDVRAWDHDDETWGDAVTVTLAVGTAMAGLGSGLLMMTKRKRKRTRSRKRRKKFRKARIQ